MSFAAEEVNTILMLQHLAPGGCAAGSGSGTWLGGVLRGILFKLNHWHMFGVFAYMEKAAICLHPQFF